jgi:Pectate lyase superfamily protein
MPVVPNLGTSHSDIASEIIHASSINEITTFLNRLGIVNALDYGADPTGAADSSTAINNAIAALPVSGGTVYLPAGTYKINSVINIGNGSQSGLSTRWGVTLQGATPSSGWGLQGGPTLTQQGTRLTAGTAGMTMISVNGPLTGWGVQDLILDGQTNASYGLFETSCMGGDCQNLSFYNMNVASHYTKSLNQTGALSTIAPNHARNHYRNFFIFVRVALAANFLSAIWTDGAGGTGGTDSWGDEWNQIVIEFASAPVVSSGITCYGIAMEACDSQTFRNVTFINTGNVTGAANYALRFDHTNVWGTFVPSSNSVDTVDFGSAQAVIVQYGTATANAIASNRIVGIRKVNAVPSDPAVNGVTWGYTASNP